MLYLDKSCTGTLDFNDVKHLNELESRGHGSGNI